MGLGRVIVKRNAVGGQGDLEEVRLSFILSPPSLPLKPNATKEAGDRQAGPEMRGG